MSEIPSFEAGRLAANARLYKYDPALDAAADLWDTDRQAWLQLHPLLQDQASIHRDFREQYRAAVAAGAIIEEEDE